MRTEAAVKSTVDTHSYGYRITNLISRSPRLVLLSGQDLDISFRAVLTVLTALHSRPPTARSSQPG